MTNVFSKPVRMNNAWRITWLAWSAKLRMEPSFMVTEVFEHMVPVWIPVKPEKTFTSWYFVGCLWTPYSRISRVEFLELERMHDNVDGVSMENIQSYLKLRNYSRLFYTELYPVVLLMLSMVSICNNTHTSTYKNTSVQSLNYFN